MARFVDLGSAPHRHGGRTVMLVASLLLALGACSSGSSPAASTTTVPGGASTTGGSTPASGSVGGSTSTSPADAQAAIRTAYQTFFTGGTGTIDAKVAALENGEKYRSMLTDANANAQFQSLTVDVRDVTVSTAAECATAGEASPCAAVTFDLLVGGAPMVVARTGHAVQVDGMWKVSSSTWCAVVAIGGETCP